MENKNLITVTSNSDSTIVINLPELNMRRTWKKRGQQYVFNRNDLLMAYYDPSVEYLFKNGILSTKDKSFLVEVGMIPDEEAELFELDEKLMKRMLRLMPLQEFKQTLAKMSHSQIDDFIEYAVEHYDELQMDRIDILSKVSRRDILKTIANYKAGLEG